MSRHVSTGSIKTRPSAISTKSFSRYEPTTSSPLEGRHRASTIASPSTAPRLSQEEDRMDVFNKAGLEDEGEVESPSLDRVQSLPDKFDELPIELASLTDRFVESLTTKAYAEPPSIDQISELFQEFYQRASASISIHISALRSRLNRGTSPSPSKASSRAKILSKKESSDTLAPSHLDGSQQMLTASEVTEKRKQRKLLEYKKILLEEAVERRACEKIYDRIWRHKSTLDEVRDEKLRSKTAALALVGIGLKDLGIELGSDSSKTLEDVQESLAPAREDLVKMDAEKYPLGKLQHLTAAHKAIVETLSSIHGSSSSADEILPTLIYTLITSPIEGINIISNLCFIQRFRASSKIDGEAAYCMTNLEAAIGFLEDVDLASLRADEYPEGPRKIASGTETPIVETSEPFPALSSNMPAPAQTTTATDNSSVSATSVNSRDRATKQPTSFVSLPSPRHQRTLSEILQPFQAANEAVRNTADESFKNISNTLDNSLKFFFGRLKEQSDDPSLANEITVPKTLDEARKLVSRPMTHESLDDGAAISETSSTAGEVTPDGASTLEKGKSASEDKLLALFGGRKPDSVRERSVDSLRSNNSSRRVAFASGAHSNETPQPKANSPVTTGPSTINPLDSVKNLGSSLNPLNHIGNAFGGSFRGFGRSPATTPSPMGTGTLNLKKEKDDSKTVSFGKDIENIKADGTGENLTISVDAPEQISAQIRSVPPPIRRFMEMSDPEEMKLREVAELLRDYQRLARLLSQLSSATNE